MSYTPRGAARAFIDWVLTQEMDEHIEYPYCKHQKTGYGVLHGKPIHQYVCEEAHGPRPPGKEVAHSCMVKACVNKRHLSWKTRKENEADKLRDGTRSRGERRPSAKLTEVRVREIRAKYAEGACSKASLAREYGVSDWTVRAVLKGQQWGWLS